MSQTLQYGQFRRNLSKKKTLLYPTAPSTVEGVIDAYDDNVVLLKYGMSKVNTSERFYRGSIVQEHFKYTIFVSPSILAKIEGMTERRYHIDATFKVVPNGQYTQLLVIHINYAEHCFPFIYVLMTRKTQESYWHLFQYIEDNICHLGPKSFISDYETALRNALRYVYPEADIIGCYFHYCQAIKKKSSKIANFLTLLQSDASAKKLYHKFLALPLVRLDLIPAASAHLIAQSLAFGKPFADFVDYFETQWIRKETALSFCVFKKISRTNNLVESHNSRLGSKIHRNGNFLSLLKSS